MLLERSAPQALSHFLPNPSAQEMGLAEGFRYAVSCACLQNQVDRPLKIDPESRGDIERLYPPTGSQRSANHPSVEQEILRISLPRSHLVMKSQESVFGASYGRAIEEKSHVRGQAHSSRVGNSLAIENPHVRRPVDFLCRFKENWTLPEAQKPRDVRKRDSPHFPDLIHHSQIRE